MDTEKLDETHPLYEEIGEANWPAFLAWIESGAGCLNASHFNDSYCGSWQEFGIYATNHAADIGLLDDIPDEIAMYFNWSVWISDLQHIYTVLENPQGEVWIFRDF